MGKIKSTSQQLCEGERSSTQAPVQAFPRVASPLLSLTSSGSVSWSAMGHGDNRCLRMKGKCMAKGLSLQPYTKLVINVPGTVGKQK